MESITTLLPLAQNDHGLSETAKCNGEGAQCGCRILVALWGGWQNITLFEVLMLPICSLVAKETNAPNMYCTTLIVRVFLFFAITVLFVLLSTLCSLHQIIILMCLKI